MLVITDKRSRIATASTAIVWERCRQRTTLLLMVPMPSRTLALRNANMQIYCDINKLDYM